MNESEPSMRCRENELSVKTAASLAAEEERGGNLFTGYVADVIQGA